jgi:sigma-B regulation protein RsbU (phosphoserine phosphatase)
MPRRLPFWLLLCVAFMIAGSWLFAGISIATRIDILFIARNLPTAPFQIQYSDRIFKLDHAWSKSGAAVGDRILSIQGEPFTGEAQEYRQIHGAHGGDLYHVRLQKPDGRQVEIAFPLPALPYNKPQALGWATLNIFLVMIFPSFCLAIGTWVLLARPRDWNAWYVFVILLFPQTFFGLQQFFTGFFFTFMAFWQDWSQSVFLLAMLFFGLDFSMRFEWERRLPWLRWLVAGPLIFAFVFIDSFEILAREYAPAWFVDPLPVLFRANDRVENALGIVCISVFCAAVFSKFFHAKAGDARRRLRVLVLGSQVGLWPIFLLVIFASWKGKDASMAAPFWVFLGALLLFTLFPLSLAYAIIVERAMDVRILLRQGTQYALARGSLMVLRLIAGCLLGFTMYEIIGRHRQGVAALSLAAVAMGLLLLLRYGLESRARGWIDRRFFREAYAAEQVLSDLVGQAGAFTETEPLLDTVSRRIADTLHVENVVMLLRSGNGFRLQTAMGVEVPQNFLLSGGSESVLALEKRRGPATVYFDRPDEWLMDASDAERAALRELNAEVLLPLPGRHRLMGVMALGPKRSEQPYSKADLQLLTSVGTQTGLALENSELLANLTTEVAQRERMNRELEIAHEVQERLFPQTFPQLPGVQVTGSCRPAQGVGGDYYDCMMTGNGRLALAIGDVSGKGVSAALLMASLRASLRGQTMQGSENLAQVVSNVNALLFDSSADNRYATFFFGEYDPAGRKIYYVNAGHNPPVLLRKTSAGFERHVLGGGGPVVGLLASAQYEQCELQMQSGDLLLLYTDGISEAMNPLDEEWGEECMVAETERLWPLSAQEVLNGLVNAADHFAAGAEQHDDMTLMVMKLA